MAPARAAQPERNEIEPIVTTYDSLSLLFPFVPLLVQSRDGQAACRAIMQRNSPPMLPWPQLVPVAIGALVTCSARPPRGLLRCGWLLHHATPCPCGFHQSESLVQSCSVCRDCCNTLHKILRKVSMARNCAYANQLSPEAEVPLAYR